MKIIFTLMLTILLSACKVGEFDPERNAYYAGSTDCEQTPEKCVNGYPW